MIKKRLGRMLTGSQSTPVIDLCTSTVISSASKVQPGVQHVAHLHVHAEGTEGVLVLLSAKSLAALGAVVNVETSYVISPQLEAESLVQLERSPTGHLSMDLFEQKCVISHDPTSLLGLSNRGGQGFLVLSLCEHPRPHEITRPAPSSLHRRWTQLARQRNHGC